MPIENSLEGSVNATLDALVFETDEVTIVGEVVHPIQHCLIARDALPLEQIERVVSHPQASASARASCASACRSAEVVSADSTADAVRIVAESERAVGCARQPPLRASSTAARCWRPASRTVRRTRPASSGWRASRQTADREPTDRRLEDVDRLLGPARRPRRAGRRAAGVRRPRGQPEQDRVAAAASRASAATSSSPTSRARSTTPPIVEALDAVRRVGRDAARPRLLPGRLRGRSGASPGYTFRHRSGSRDRSRVTPAAPQGKAGDDAGLARRGPAASRRAGRPSAGAARARADSGRVLVLNSSYEPLNVCTVRRAVVLVLKEKAELLEHGEPHAALRERAPSRTRS